MNNSEAEPTTRENINEPLISIPQAADNNKNAIITNIKGAFTGMKTKKEKKKKEKNKHGRMNRPAIPDRTRASKVGIEDLSQNDVIIAVMGLTGSGKSTFINVATEYTTEVGHSLESCTSEIGIIKLSYPEWSDCDIVFIDTPGFDNTHKSDLDILKMISEWLSATYKKKILLSGILYLHRISDNINPMAGTTLKNLRIFEDLCGENAFHNVILTTTMWDEVSEDLGKQYEDELIHNYWKNIMDRGSKIMRFKNDRHSAFLILAPLLESANRRQALLLQQEMVDMHYQLLGTSACRALFTKVGALVKEKQDVLGRIRNEMKRTSDDQKTMDVLRAEFQQLNIELYRMVEEMPAIKLSLGDRLLKSIVSRLGISVRR